MSESIFEAKDIVFNYPDGTRGLKNLSIKIPHNKKVAILGPNGAGKSTLFLHFNGVLQPDQGSIFFKGEKLNYRKEELKKIRKKVGIVFQDPDMQLFSASVFQEISFGPLNLGLSKSEVKKRVFEAMERTGISHLEDRPTHLLSYGQKKRVSIADILVMKPDVIVFDEPTVWLDPGTSKEIIDFFDQLHQAGIEIIISTHDVNLAYSWADYIYIMNNGEIIGEGKSEKVFQNTELLKQANLLEPWVIEIYNQLAQKGILNKDNIPGSKKELLKMINSI